MSTSAQLSVVVLGGKVRAASARDALERTLPGARVRVLGRPDELREADVVVAVDDEATDSVRRTHPELPLVVWVPDRSEVREEAGSIFYHAGSAEGLGAAVIATLAEEARRVRSRIEALPVGVFRTTVGGRIVYASAAVRKLLGLDENTDLSAVDVSGFWVDPSERAKVLERIEAGEELRGEEIRVRRSDGSEVWVRESSRAIRDGSGKLVALEGVLENVTEEHRLREALIRGKRAWELTFDVLPDFVVLSDEDGRIRRLNRAMAAALGGRPQELVGRELPEPWLAASRRADRQRCLFGPDDGFSGQYLVSSAEITGEEGEALRVSIFRDVSELERLRREAERSMTMFRALAEANLAGVYLIKKDRFAYVNPALARIAGYEPAEMIGRMGPLDVTWPEDRELVRENLRRRFEGEVEELQYRFRLVHRDGHPVPVEVLGRRVELEGEVAVLGTLLDISPRVEAERRSRLALGRLRALVEEFPEALLLLAEDGEVLLANGAAVRLSEGGLLGELDKPVTQVLGGPVAELGPEPAEVEYGGRFFALAARPVEGPAGEERLVVIRDVTREKEAVQRLARQERLAAVGRLAAGIAHDFNNLLQSVMTSTELMLMAASDNPAVQRHGQIVLSQAERGGRLVRQILDFTRRSLRRPKRLEVGALVRETAELLRSSVRENVRLEVQVEPGEHWVVGDTAQLEQVVTNLVVNGAEAMPEGGLLRVEVAGITVTEGDPPPAEEVSPGRWIAISVADTGIGIPEELHAKIFEPFFTTRSLADGTGLGLAQVWGIVQQHSGAIRVKSRVGVGSIFTVYLPAAEPPSAGSREEGEDARDQRSPGQGELILVAEDDPAVCRSLVAAIREQGFEVVAAADGLVALETFERMRERMAAVVTDAVMPRLGGVDLASRLRAAGFEGPIVMLSGYPVGLDGGATRDAGVNRWLTKPVTATQLAQVLSELLGR